MKYLVMILLIVAGIIHLLPAFGVLGASNLASLYGVEIKDPNLLIMMRHRAVLLTLLGTLLVCAAFKPSLHAIAIFGGLVSATAFLWLALNTPEYNSNMATVVTADVVAIVCLLIAAMIRCFWQPA